MEVARTGSITPVPPLSAPAVMLGAPPPATTLPADKVVSGTPRAAAADDGGGGAARAVAAGWAERRVVVDPGTQELVTQTIDRDTDALVAQTPDRAQLGLRAYIDEVNRRQEAARGTGVEARRLPALIV